MAANGTDRASTTIKHGFFLISEAPVCRSNRRGFLSLHAARTALLEPGSVPHGARGWLHNLGKRSDAELGRSVGHERKSLFGQMTLTLVPYGAAKLRITDRKSTRLNSSH